MASIMGNRADKIVKCKTCGEQYPFGQINQHRKKHPAKAKEPEAPQPPTAPESGEAPPAVAAQFTVTESERVVEDMPVLDRAEPTQSPPPTAPLPPLPSPPKPTGISCGPFVDILCGIFDRSVEESAGNADGPPALPGPITQDERRAIAESLEPLLMKWLPKLGPYALELNCLLVTAAVFGPRLLAAKQRKNWIEEKRGQTPNNHAQPAPPQPVVTNKDDDLLRIGDKWVGKVGR